ncbi:hypothetical protein [Dactylosporangium roseum]|uniref:hypothetical protein n=1 Tax=Dactylosporangium roseum TaxID=47989 RepID=UPI0028C3BCE0|nr:hypothetical protein [Dactylosporangium roseum]
MSTYDVRIWGISTYEVKDRKTGKKKLAYQLRWLVAGKRFSKAFQTQALAESFRSRLIVAQREGVAFDEPSGLPEPMARELRACSWFEHATEFVDMKWPRAAATQRKSIAESLATVTPALLLTERGAPSDREIRRALYAWAFNKAQRDAGPPHDEHVRAIDWLRRNTVKLAALTDAGLVRKALDQLALKTDGQGGGTEHSRSQASRLLRRVAVRS